MNTRKRMRELLASDDIIVSPGVFDGYSARMVEKMGFKAASTTGAGLANSRCGVPDVGIMGLTDNLDACRMIARSVSIPIMADADTGYGNAVTVYHAIRLFEDAGVAGVNIEDQVSPKRCGHMEGKDVISPGEMSSKIEAACDARRDNDFVVLARTDALAVEGIEGTLGRIRIYADAGADMIFVDAVETEDQIKTIVEASPAPISVNMGFGIRQRPTTPLIPVRRLQELGVKRVSMPRMLPAAALMAMRNALAVFNEAMENGEAAHRPDLLVGIEDIWSLMGQPEMRQMEMRYATEAP